MNRRNLRGDMTMVGGQRATSSSHVRESAHTRLLSSHSLERSKVEPTASQLERSEGGAVVVEPSCPLSIGRRSWLAGLRLHLAHRTCRSMLMSIPKLLVLTFPPLHSSRRQRSGVTSRGESQMNNRIGSNRRAVAARRDDQTRRRRRAAREARRTSQREKENQWESNSTRTRDGGGNKHGRQGEAVRGGWKMDEALRLEVRGRAEPSTGRYRRAVRPSSWVCRKTEDQKGAN